MRRRRGWILELISCWWIVLTLALGIFSWVAFAYAGIRAKKRLWLLSAGVYILPFVVAFVEGDAISRDTKGGIYLASMVVSFVHALLIRNEFLNRLEILRDATPLPMSEADIDSEIAKRILQLKQEKVDAEMQRLEERSEQLWEEELESKTEVPRSSGRDEPASLGDRSPEKSLDGTGQGVDV